MAKKCKYQIWTHTRPHVDELFAILLLLVYGEKWFPGISEAEIIFFDMGDPLPQKHTFKEWWSRGVVIVGLKAKDRGAFDEHAGLGEKRLRKDCAATLVAKRLKVDKYPEVMLLLETVRKNDLYGEKGSALDLCKIMDAKWQFMDHDEVVEQSMRDLQFLLMSQTELWSVKLGNILKKFSHTRVIEGEYGEKYRIAIVHTDHELAATRLFEDYGLIRENFRPNVIIVQDPKTKQVGIFQRGANLDETARLIRRAEAIARGLKPASDEVLSKEEETPEQIWYYWHGQTKPTPDRDSESVPMGLFNGGIRAKMIRPTCLSLRMIEELVIKGLKVGQMSPEERRQKKAARAATRAAAR
ncbi:MAG: hypothetical protein IT410_03400 [Candidatus Doudnabacteria bacterium]|nr:hypothetical protein [Candidatus Doudnabacteria bacterium]